MPTLHWIGKEKVVNHHLDVPFRVLQHGYGFHAGQGAGETPTASGNKIIHGDNLEALKSLLPEYEGKVKCIYIDPPYNTGNEGWVYNDNVNDPKIKKWLAQVVGKEGEDLSRHDKWLCMMYPRLKLLNKLLSEDGAIWISIDDIEVHLLRLVLDELFGANNFVANIVWQKRTSPDARATLGAGHEHIVVYAKSWGLFREKLKKLPLSAKQKSVFKNPDNDPRGPWVSTDFTAQGYRPNQMYEIVTSSGKKCLPPEGRCWINVESIYQELHKDGRMWYGTDGSAFPRRKTYLNEREGISAWTWWPNDEVGHNQEGKQEIGAIFASTTVFDTPKPSRLLQRIIELYSAENDIILDSFAGSGTTAHAVLNLNQQDGGNRKFILIEMEDYADTITAERVKRVMDGYGEGKNAVPGTGGAFDYYTLGPRLFLENDQLNEAVGIPEIRAYIWYSETRSSFVEPGGDEPYFLGKLDATAYYFVYDPEAATSLDYTFLSTIRQQAGQYVIYADHCLLPADFMARRNIVFKKIPRDITRF